MNNPSAQSTPPALQLRPRGIRSRQLIPHVQANIVFASTILFLLALVLRLYHLGTQSLWLDEGGTWAEVTGQGWGKLIADLWSMDAAYPLYHLVLKGWVGLAGDSEWALRFPSALSGAAATVAVFFAAVELELYGSVDGRRRTEDEYVITGLNIRPPSSVLRPAIAALLFMLAPFAVWHAQDAKVYSLLLLCAAALLWALLRALRLGGARAWFVALAVGCASVFVHRLAILGIVGALLAVALAWPFGLGTAARMQGRLAVARGALMLVALCGAAVAIYGLVRAVGVESRGGTGHIPAGPFAGLWLTLAHFALDRGNIGGWLGMPLIVWALPALALTCWGFVLAARDARRGDAAALAVLGLFAAPLLLFAAALAFVRLFEARYVTVAFPSWIVLLAYPLLVCGRHVAEDLHGIAGFRASKTGRMIAVVLCAATLLVDVVVLWQPQHGLFSGAPVKEQWREGVAEIGRRVHPDDLLIVHPYYVAPMWGYYAPRVTPDPLPSPVTFNVLGEGDCLKQEVPVECYRKRYEKDFDDAARGHKRMLMLIAPDHARTIDPPKTVAELLADWQKQPADTRGEPPSRPDRFGVLGLRFQYANQQRTWPCGDTNNALIGVEVMCASFPSFYRQSGPAAIPQPRVKLAAVFGGELGLRGYTIDAAGGKLRPGGTLPITLYWAAQAPPTHDYTMFLHLCQDCDVPPAAQFDRPPLDGQFPAGQTSTWRVGDPVHDERAIPLVDADGRPIAPGRYTLLLGVYPAGLAAPQLSDRLPVTSADAEVRGGTRLVLGEVTIGP